VHEVDSFVALKIVVFFALILPSAKSGQKKKTPTIFLYMSGLHPVSSPFREDNFMQYFILEI